MARRKRSSTVPGLMAALTAASLETIARRTLMIATGTCSPAEYTRMVQEKMLAAHQSTLALLMGGSASAVLRPWHRRASANARRLRRH